MADDDADLVRRFNRGDTGAFEILVRRYQRPVFSFLLRLSGDQDTAEDLFQETMLKVLHGLPDYEERGKFKSWIFGIANRAAVDAWRQGAAQRKCEVQAGQAIDGAVDPRETPDVSAERSDLATRIDTILRGLPEKQRRVFLLRQQGEMSFREIADSMGEPLNTVIGHMHYAMARLRKILNPPGEDL